MSQILFDMRTPKNIEIKTINPDLAKLNNSLASLGKKMVKTNLITFINVGECIKLRLDCMIAQLMMRKREDIVDRFSKDDEKVNEPPSKRSRQSQDPSSDSSPVQIIENTGWSWIDVRSKAQIFRCQEVEMPR